MPRAACCSRSPRAWWRTVGTATLLTGLACLVNPYGLKGALYPLQLAGSTIPGYAAFYAFILNSVVTVILTYVFNAASAPKGADETKELDYTAAAA